MKANPHERKSNAELVLEMSRLHKLSQRLFEDDLAIFLMIPGPRGELAQIEHQSKYERLLSEGPDPLQYFPDDYPSLKAEVDKRGIEYTPDKSFQDQRLRDIIKK